MPPTAQSAAIAKPTGQRSIAESPPGERRRGPSFVQPTYMKIATNAARLRADHLVLDLTVRWLDKNDRMAAKLVGLFCLLLATMVVLYFVAVLGN